MNRSAADLERLDPEPRFPNLINSSPYRADQVVRSYRLDFVRHAMTVKKLERLRPCAQRGQSYENEIGRCGQRNAWSPLFCTRGGRGESELISQWPFPLILLDNFTKLARHKNQPTPILSDAVLALKLR